MVTMGGNLQPGCLADHSLNALGQSQINVKCELRKKEKTFGVLIIQKCLSTACVASFFVFTLQKCFSTACVVLFFVFTLQNVKS